VALVTFQGMAKIPPGATMDVGLSYRASKAETIDLIAEILLKAPRH
jgi:hypothetical protein